MKIRVRFYLPLAGAALVLALPLLTAAESKPLNEADTIATKQSIQDIRSVGTAMYAWYKAEMAPKRSPESHKKAEEAANAPSIDISAVPEISREELAMVLVPKYIASIPEKDGWGHPYDFHLDTKNPDAIPVMGLRSAGRDGTFSGNVYQVGGFAPADADQDISWVDGYFVRWPEK